ncbi:MAG: hypothetical protein AAAB23_18955, partial [Pseudomonas sp.]
VLLRFGQEVQALPRADPVKPVSIAEIPAPRPAYAVAAFCHLNHRATLKERGNDGADTTF